MRFGSDLASTDHMHLDSFHCSFMHLTNHVCLVSIYLMIYILYSEEPGCLSVPLLFSLYWPVNVWSIITYSNSSNHHLRHYFTPVSLLLFYKVSQLHCV